MAIHSVHRFPALLGLIVILALGLTAGGVPITAQQASISVHPSPAAPDATFRSSPVMFVENAGQWPETARFQIWGGSAGTMWLAEDAIWLTVAEQTLAAGSRADRLRRPDPATFDLQPADVPPTRGVNVRLSFVGANPHPRIEPFDRLDTVVSYFIGNEPNKWRPDVPVWGGVRYVDLYPGVDLEVTSEYGQMVQRLASRPSADLSTVRLRVEGVDAVALDGDTLRLGTPAGVALLPLLQAEGASGDAEMQPSGVEAFDVGAPFAAARQDLRSTLCDAAKAVADPQASSLLYGTYLGGNDADYGNGIAVDEVSGAYVTGQTRSINFPTTPGAFDWAFNGGVYDAFVAKLNTTSGGLAYAAFLGGSSSDEEGLGIAVDGAGSAYVTGITDSADFPTTPGAFDQTPGFTDAFVVKLNPTGNGLVYSTFLGGFSHERGWGITVDGTGSAYVTGQTYSSDFPTTSGVFDRAYNGGIDAFVAKLNPTGSGLVYATFLGGGGQDEGHAIAVDGASRAYVTGISGSKDFPTTASAFDRSFNGSWDAFVVKLDPAGSGLAYATFLGGSALEWSSGIAVDGTGRAYVTGSTSSGDFPTTPGAFDTSYNGGGDYYGDSFVVKLQPAGDGLVYATFLGGGQQDRGTAIAVDGTGSAHITGWTSSRAFPSTPDALYPNYNGYGDAFVVKLNPAGSGLAYATFLGGNDSNFGNGIAVDTAGNAYVAGTTWSADFFPTTPGAFDRTYNGSEDAFVVKLAMRGAIVPPTPTPTVTPTPTPTTYTISGRVTEAGGFTGIPGVTVWADATHSTTTNANGDYTLTGLPAGTYNIRPEKAPYAFSPASRAISVPADQTGVDFRRVAITRIQVNQVLGNTTNYVAGKDTAVRVFMSGPVPYDPDHQQLQVYRNGSLITPTPLRPRSFTGHSDVLDFLCDRQECDGWQRGFYSFEARVNGDYLSQPSVEFKERARLRILEVPVKAKVNGQVKEPTERWKTAHEVISKWYPVASDAVSYTRAAVPLDATDLNLAWPLDVMRLWDRARRLQPSPCGSSAQPACYDLILAITPEDPAALLGNTIAPPAVIAMDGSRLPSRVAHEVGHLIGYSGIQPGLGDEYGGQCGAFRCDANPPPASYTGKNGRAGICELQFHCPEQVPPVQSWEPLMGSKVTAAVDMPYEVGGRGAAQNDKLSFMGGDGEQAVNYWVSPAAYDFLYAHLPASTAATTQALQAVERVAAVSGWIAADGSGSLGPIYHSMGPPPSVEAGPYTVEVRSAAGSLLSSQGFDVSFVLLTNPPQQVNEMPFQVQVRLPAESSTIRLMHGGDVLAETQVSAHPPSLALITPERGDIWPAEGSRTIRWQGSDLDGDTLHYTVLYHQGAGDWSVLGADLTASELIVNAAGLPGGTAAQVQVWATDGINTTIAESGLFTVGRKGPEAFITYPAEGASFMPGASFFLQGTAYDLEDGRLPDSAYRWASNRDGDLGAGASNLVILSPGAHVITLRVTDSDGNTAVKTMRLSAGDRVFLPLIWRAR